MNETHPLITQKAHTFPIHFDLYQSVDRRISEWNALVATIEALSPSADNAEALLRHGAELVSSLVTDCGPVHGWELGCRRFLHEQSVRLLPVEARFNPPNWVEP